MIGTIFGMVVCALLFALFGGFVKVRAEGCGGSGGGKCESCDHHCQAESLEP